jgi:ribosomal protein RSM22 (predicted rRNA methylase)
VLPKAQSQILTQMLEGVSRRALAGRAAALSNAYRGGGTSQTIANTADGLAYLVARAPATFAAAGAALARLAETMPDFAPRTLLDVGAGPGTASWAARERWPGIAVTMLDHNKVMRGLAAQLMPDADIRAGDAGSDLPKADLVIANYVLAELPQNAAAGIAKRLWDRAEVLLLVEPGTPAGFARLKAARTALIGEGAHVAAPCTHDEACPITGKDWCHFSVRLARSRDHLIAKDASVPFEDEPYSYLAVARHKAAQGARIIKPPLDAKPGLTLPLCDADGLRDQFVARRDKEGYRRVRKLGWGDRL